MKNSQYHEGDYAYGQIMLNLRVKVGLTQARLAGYVGVSRRTVGNWESGNSYPKAENLRKLIALAVERKVFQAGREEEIRDLWRAGHQKVLLDEAWLAGLLNNAGQPTPLPEAELISSSSAGFEKPTDRPLLDWEDAFAVPTFYGREGELDLVREWVVEDRCRVVSVLGLGGIGKSALAVSLMHQVAEHFDVVIWRSLLDLPTCEVLLEDLLHVLVPQSPEYRSDSIEQRQSILLEQMRRKRILMVLDNLDTLLEDGKSAGHMRRGYEGFERFLLRCAGSENQACVLLTSREKPGILIPFEGHQAPIRTMRLARLEFDACKSLLMEKNISGSPAEMAKLIEFYTGNPLALKIVAQTIVDLFDGDIGPFIEQGEVIFGDILELLSEQFRRLSAIEQCVLFWLAILHEPSTLDELLAVMIPPVARGQLLEAVDSLYRRSMIERGWRKGSFSLQSFVLEFLNTWLIQETGIGAQESGSRRLVEH